MATDSKSTDIHAKADAGKSWWTTLPGVLTALAAVLTAVSGLLAVLAQQGVIGGKRAAASSESAGAATVAPHTPAATAPATATTTETAQAAQSPATAGGAKVTPDVAALRSQGFKGAVVTLADGATVRVAPGLKEYIQGERIKLETGQYIDFERIQVIEVLRFSQDDQLGEVAITLTNGQSVRGKIVQAVELRGSNELGDFAQQLKAVKRVDFVR